MNYRMCRNNTQNIILRGHRPSLNSDFFVLMLFFGRNTLYQVQMKTNLKLGRDMWIDGPDHPGPFVPITAVYHFTPSSQKLFRLDIGFMSVTIDVVSIPCTQCVAHT